MIRLKDLLRESEEDIKSIANEFIKSNSYKPYPTHDCKRSTYEFIKWVKQNKGIEPDVLLLAPPKNIEKFPGVSGDGDSHIFSILNGFGIDFTAKQFDLSQPDIKITPESDIESQYKKIGGYYTNYPDWFEDGETFIKSKIGKLPKWFLDGAAKEGFKPEDI